MAPAHIPVFCIAEILYSIREHVALFLAWPPADITLVPGRARGEPCALRLGASRNVVVHAALHQDGTAGPA